MKQKTYTVLNQPTDSPTEVWCRMDMTVNSQERFKAVKMKSDTQLGDGTTVWSVKVSAAFDPTKVGFFTSQEAAEADGAAVSAAVVSQSASAWNDITGGKYILIGGHATASPRRASADEDEKLDMSLVMAPETQLNVYVDGQWSADLSSNYGFGDKVTITAPAVSGKMVSTTYRAAASMALPKKVCTSWMAKR